MAWTQQETAEIRRRLESWGAMSDEDFARYVAGSGEFYASTAMRAIEEFRRDPKLVRRPKPIEIERACREQIKKAMAAKQAKVAESVGDCAICGGLKQAVVSFWALPMDSEDWSQIDEADIRIGAVKAPDPFVDVWVLHPGLHDQHKVGKRIICHLGCECAGAGARKFFGKFATAGVDWLASGGESRIIRAALGESLPPLDRTMMTFPEWINSLGEAKEATLERWNRLVRKMRTWGKMDVERAAE